MTTKIPVELSSTPGIVDGSNATAITIDSSENVGIGTSSPQALNHISSGYSAPTGGIDSNIFSLISNSASTGSYAGLGLLAGNAAASFIHFGDTDDMNSGTLDYFHSDNSMRFSTNGGERMRIDSSGNLLVGKTSNTISAAGAKLGTGGSNFTRDNSEVVYVNRTTSDGSLITLAKDGSTVGSIGNSGANIIYYAGAGSGVKILNPSSGFDGLMPCSTTGADRDASMDLGSANTRFKDLYLSGGAYLGGTGSANHLDDYEEGTWTPVVKINSSTTGITGNFSGTYTKVGREVTVVCVIGLTNKGSTTGNLLIDSLPFNSGNLSMRFHGSVGYYHLTLSSGDHPRARLTSQNSGFDIQRNHEISPVSNTNLANNTEFYVTLTYFTD